MSGIEIALFIADRVIGVARYLQGRDTGGVEIGVTKMFYKRQVAGPVLWEFDPETFENGMPVRVINHSKTKYYSISFFRFRTIIKKGKKLTIHEHATVYLDKDHKNYSLVPGHAVDFSIPWKAAMYSAHASRELQKQTTHVNEHTFVLSFHDDFTNLDYDSKPLDPFRVRSEGSSTVHRW